MQPLAAASPRRQKGAVAILVGLSIVVLVMMLGLVLDLGQLYITRTELQNAADAAALAGAREMNGTAAGITSAEARAISTAAANSVRFGANAGAVTIGRANVEYGPSPDGPWSVYAAAFAAPGGMSFIKVDTHGISQGGLVTWFMRVSNIDVMNTFGRAVAGTYSTDIAPMGVCAIDPANPTRGVNRGGLVELEEYGFRRGMSYNIVQINDQKKGLAGLAQVPLWINPVDSYPAPCDPANGSNAVLGPFLCQGKSGSVPVAGGTVYINTGAQASQDRFLNSRLNDYQGNACDPVTAPPDTNIQQYRFDAPTPPGPPGDPNICPLNTNHAHCALNPPGAQCRCGQPREWTDPLANNQPIQQSVTTSEGVPAISGLGDMGALWSYTRAVRYDASASDKVGTPFALADWPTLYGFGLSADTDTTTPAVRYGYPTSVGAGFPAGTQPAPYNQTTGKYYQGPTSNLALALVGRRAVNLAIINCNQTAGSSGSCRTMNVLGIGRFFMTRGSNLPNNLNMEFAGLVPPSQLQQRDIRLFR